jgi:cell division transport system permease protein
MVEVSHKFKVRKKKLGSYPYVSVILSITLALFVIGIFGALVIYAQELERTVQENVKIQVFLKNHLTDAQRLQVEKSLYSKNFLPKSKKEKAIQFVSKEDAAKAFIRETGEDFQKFLGENPLRAAYLVNIDPAYQDNDSMQKIKQDVESISGVFQVYYVENVIQSINRNVTQIGLALMGLAALLLVTVVLLIHNTLRLALFSQRFLIRSMQLVGARKWFIQKPFLLRASLHGLVAGLIASALLIGLIYYANRQIEELSLIQNDERLIVVTASLFALGIIVAVFSTQQAVNKYLKLSLDELY